MSARTFSASTPGRYGNVTVFESDGGYSVQLHRTVVARLDRGTITLNTGGWRTPTTKTAINNALAQWGCPARIHQNDFCWYVSAGRGPDRDFRDGIEIDAHNGNVVGLPVREVAHA